MKPGIHDLPIAAYVADPCDPVSLSGSGVPLINRCPVKWWHASKLNPKRPAPDSKPAFDFGKAVHHLLLEPGKPAAEFYVLPEGYDGRLKEWREEKEAAAAAEAEGVVVVCHETWQTAEEMVAVLRGSWAAAAFEAGEAERTLAWRDEETGIWLRARPDFLPTALRHIPNYKTARSAAPDDFMRDAFNYGYFISAALHLEGIEAVTGTAPESFLFIVQEKEPPYVVQPYALSDVALGWGRMHVTKAKHTLARCLETGQWPGYADDVLELDLPGWAERQMEAASERGWFDVYAPDQGEAA